MRWVIHLKSRCEWAACRPGFETRATPLTMTLCSTLMEAARQSQKQTHAKISTWPWGRLLSCLYPTPTCIPNSREAEPCLLSHRALLESGIIPDPEKVTNNHLAVGSMISELTMVLFLSTFAHDLTFKIKQNKTGKASGFPEYLYQTRFKLVVLERNMEKHTMLVFR